MPGGPYSKPMTKPFANSNTDEPPPIQRQAAYKPLGHQSSLDNPAEIRSFAFRTALYLAMYNAAGVEATQLDLESILTDAGKIEAYVERPNA